MQNEFLTVKEIAERLRVNQQTVRNWIERGLLPAIRTGRRVRVRRSDYEQFVGEQAESAQTPDRFYTVPGFKPTNPSAQGARFDNIRIAQASEQAVDLEDLARLTGYTLDEKGMFRRRITYMARNGQIDPRFAQSTRRPSENEFGSEALEQPQITSLSDLADEMFSWAARLPEDSSLSCDLAEVAGRIKAFTLRASRRAGAFVKKNTETPSH